MTGRLEDHHARPRLVAPPGACETHSHVFGPPDRYPPYEGRGRMPHPEATAAAYRAMLDRLGIERGVIVQPSLYAADNRATLDTIQHLGPERTRGVAVTRPDVDRSELEELHAAGIRGMRFFLYASDLGLEDLQTVASRIEPLGWHVVVQGDGENFLGWLPYLKDLPVPVVIDHMGRFPVPLDLNDPAFAAFLKFVETGRCWVKLSGPYMSSAEGPPRYADTAPRARAILNARPDRMLWAANWPHPGSPRDDKPEEAECLDLLLDWAPDEAVRKAILVDNPATLYGFD